MRGLNGGLGGELHDDATLYLALLFFRVFWGSEEKGPTAERLYLYVSIIGWRFLERVRSMRTRMCMSMYGLICVGVHGIAMIAFMILQCRFASVMWREDVRLWIMYIAS